MSLDGNPAGEEPRGAGTRQRRPPRGFTFLRFYRDGLRIGSLVIRWRGGWTVKERVVGLYLARGRDDGTFYMVAGLWWIVSRIEWWKEAL
jgi:hypothetical protein